MRFILFFLMLGHAVAHLPGFLVNLRLRTFPELPFKTTILLDSVDVGQAGIRVLGFAWLAAFIALSVVAVATALRLSWWQPAAYATLGLSMLLCLLAWPDTRFGVLANVVILSAIVFSAGSLARIAAN
ncbi:MAG TPA: hypothetical protein VNT81_08005 [Vicinamibacterales bacterium]|nr:hypothetical protein [Vicinamibacterales bacterium]